MCNRAVYMPLYQNNNIYLTVFFKTIEKCAQLFRKIPYQSVDFPRNITEVL